MILSILKNNYDRLNSCRYGSAKPIHTTHNPNPHSLPCTSNILILSPSTISFFWTDDEYSLHVRLLKMFITARPQSGSKATSWLATIMLNFTAYNFLIRVPSLFALTTHHYVMQTVMSSTASSPVVKLPGIDLAHKVLKCSHGQALSFEYSQ